MTDQDFEASLTVIEAAARTEAILRKHDSLPVRRPEAAPLPQPQRRRGIAWLQTLRTRLTG